MSRRRIIWIVLVLLMLGGAGGLAVAFDPAARVQGWVRGEPFFQDQSATAWRRELRNPDENTAIAATTALTSGRDKAIPVCVWLLKNADESQVRWRAAEALGKMGKDAAPAGPDLVVAFTDSDAFVRGVAIRVVGDLAPDVPGAVAGLIQLFPDVEAIKAVAKFKKTGAEAVPKLLELTRHEDAAVRRQAIQAISDIGLSATEGIPVMVRALKDPDAIVRGVAIRVVGDLAPDVPGGVAGLIQLFPDVEAIKAVAKFKKAGAEAVPKLIELTRHEDAAVRRQTVRALGKIGVPAMASLPALITLTGTDPISGVREQSAEAIGDIGPTAAEGIPVLVKALKDSDTMVRRDAVRSLGQMGPTAKSVLSEVRALTKDPEEKVRDAATKAARLIDP